MNCLTLNMEKVRKGSKPRGEKAMAGQDRKNTVLADCLGQAQELAGLVEYAKDSIVSKTILSKSLHMLVLFIPLPHFPYLQME